MPRKIKENALTREGVMLTAMLHKKEMEYLESEAQKTGLSKSYIIRQLINRLIEDQKLDQKHNE